MVDIKEIKSIKLAPFTLMSSSVQAILALIAAILMLILFGIIAIFIPEFAVLQAAITWVGVAFVIVLPISAFFIGLATNFFTAFLYNGLVPRLGGIKLGLDASEVTEIPVVSFALIMAAIEAIWAFIIGLFTAAAIAPITAVISAAIPEVAQALANATNTTGAAMPTGAVVSTLGVVGSIMLIIGLPIAVFIIGFIGHALAALFYNFIVTRVAKFKLEFEKVSETLHELKSIPILPAALAAGILFAIFGFIRGLLLLISMSAQGDAVGGFVTLIGSTIIWFIDYFVIVALAAFLYNVLVPRIGGFKLDLE
ncbi:MAG: hypothetical protein A4E27_00572 [Methanobacterium sp. PtaU1.Bin242]|nr:MAG: hypothetical protein A4E27_00572 [Methanobacterium sp. PtaU1.Bin242]